MRLIEAARRAVVVAALALIVVALPAAGTESSAGSQGPGHDHDTASAPALAASLAEGEAALRRLDIEQAQAAFDRAASMAHEPAVEVSLVRTYLQAGEYRRALAFAAHAAGAHPDYGRAAALYAWLLHAGGQDGFARSRLDAALSLVPGDPTLLQVRDELAKPWPVADSRLTQPPMRFAPYASDRSAAACVCASGTLLGDGMHALVPTQALASSPQSSPGQVWVRNGLGQTVSASIDQRLQIDGTDATILRLERSLPIPPALLAAARTPFAGSPGYAVEYAATANAAEPAWPIIRLGFFARAGNPDDTLPPLGIRSPEGPRGGPVFDNAGRIVGVALRDVHGQDRLLPVASLPASHAAAFGRPLDGAPSPAMAMDEIYERSLLVSLQVLVGERPTSR